MLSFFVYNPMVGIFRLLAICIVPVEGFIRHSVFEIISTKFKRLSSFLNIKILFKSSLSNF